MAQTFSASGSIRLGVAPVTAVPLTLACWYFRTASTDATERLLGVQDYTGQNAFNLQTQGAAGIQVRAQTVQAGTANHGYSAYSGAPNTWAHAAGVFSSTTSRVGYSNGVVWTGNSADLTPVGLSEAAIGCTVTSGAISTNFRGHLAEVAIWNAALTASEIYALSRGASPKRVRPASLVFYAPLIRNVSDQKGNSMTPAGLTVLDHPRIYP